MNFKQRIHGEPLNLVEPSINSGVTASYRSMFPDDLERDGASAGDLDNLAAATLRVTEDRENEKLPAGYTYLGQFIAHDLSFDAEPFVDDHGDSRQRRNFRTPRLELDSLYGLGPRAQPYLYSDDDPAKLRLHATLGFYLWKDGDLPRLDGGRAVIADPRNDENLLTAQLHVAFSRFHNAVVNLIDPNRDLEPIARFKRARRIVVWHYQWLVLHDFIPRIVCPNVWKNFVEGQESGLRFNGDPFIPYEFSLAAYRLHTLVRADYWVTPLEVGVVLEKLLALTGRGGWVPDHLIGDWIVDWRRFFRFKERYPKCKVDFQPANQFDPWITVALGGLRVPMEPDPISLPRKTLERGRNANLPSGQAVAKYIGVNEEERLTEKEVGMGPDRKSLGLSPKALKNTPLWYYIFREAELRAKGHHLGAVGSHIVAKVVLGLLDADPLAYNGAWTPHELAHEDFQYTKDGDFSMVDLLSFDKNLNPWANNWEWL